MKLFYRKYGSAKQNLIILHGLFGMSDNWVGIGRKLSENFTVVIPDLPNHGNSPDCDDFSFENMVKSLDDLMDDLQIENPIILGHSMGGKLAMKYSEIGKRTIKKLIVVDISMRNNTIREEHLAIIDSINNTNLDICNSVQDVEIQLRINLPHNHLVLFVLKNVKRENGKLHWKLNLQGIEPKLSSIVSGFSVNTTFSNPCLFVRGQKSDYIQDEDLPLIKKSFPMAQFETIAQAGHWVHADNPIDFFVVIFRFLTEN